MSFNKLKEEYQKCTKCPNLCDSRTQVVFGSGNPHSEIIFIGEAPGANEDRQGIPFCGMSGKILTELLTSVGLSRADIFITNTVLCRPENNRNPAKEEIENCRERLDKLLQIIQPKVIVTIGNFATQRIIGQTGIKTMHGQVFEYQGMRVVPVVHPASYLYSGRNPQMLQEMKNDFKTISAVISSKKEQQTLGNF